MSTSVSHKISNMGLVCALLVVAIHLPKHCLLVSEYVASIAVPFFFVVSGYFLAAHVGEAFWWRREVVKRCRTLLVPYFVWSGVGFMCGVWLNIIADWSAHRPFGTNFPYCDLKYWLCVFGLDICNGPYYNGPLWYVRCLFLLVVMSCCLVPLVRRFGIVWLFACAVALVGFNAFIGDANGFLDWGFPVRGVLFFSAGLWLRAGQAKLIHKLLAERHGFLALISFATFLLLSLCDCLPEIRSVFLMYAVWQIMPGRPWPVWLTSSAFPIYVMHGIVSKWTSRALPDAPYYFILLTLNVLICLAVARVLAILAPRVAAVVYGGRSR